MKIISLIGARPQFIKEAIVGDEIRKKGISHILVNTGQHYDPNMSIDFIKELKMKEPDYNLGVGSGSHAYQTATTMIRFEEIVIKEKPELILVYGDTNATIAGAIVGAKLKVPIAHVEAGLRQFPKDMPEEINRVITDHLSLFLLCPTKKAMRNLKKEGLIDRAFLVGDVMYDLFLRIKPFLKIDSILKKYFLNEKEYIFVTIHRDFNTDNLIRLSNILCAMEEINKEMQIIMSLHPRTKKIIEKNNFMKILNKIQIIEPTSYKETQALLLGAKKVITDSGGLQKEAYFAQVPAIVLMIDTCWSELVDIGANVLVDANKDLIIRKVLEHNIKVDYKRNIFGNGDAGLKIVDLILKFQKMEALN